MKNVVYWMTHKTLDFEHAVLSFQGFANQKCDSQFDELIIYNSHSEELPYTQLLDLVVRLNLSKFFKNVSVFPYVDTTHKSLGGDVYAIKEHAKATLNDHDRILLMKSDSVLSVNYFDEALNKLPSKQVYFVAPWICAKRRVTNEEILEYSQRDGFVRSDEITFFVEDQHGSTNNDFHQRPGVNVTDENIKFTSCYVIRDFSCHFLSVSLLPFVNIAQQSWGGVNFSNLSPHFIATDRCFVIHKFHDIVSENRPNDREGPVKDWLNS